jgi:hypothetical protein
MCSAAMVYMAVAMAGHGSAHAGHAGHGAAGTPLLTGLLLLYFAGYVLRMGVLVAVPAYGGLISGAGGSAGSAMSAAGPGAVAGVASAAIFGSPAGSAGPAAGRVRLRHAPEVAVACRVAMALGMFAMLVML